MDLAKALADLREQRDDIDRAILSLERLAGGRSRVPGRPPGPSLSRARKRPNTSAPANIERLKATSD
jgi:hypothetical protein